MNFFFHFWQQVKLERRWFIDRITVQSSYNVIRADFKLKDTLEPQNTLAPNALDWCKSVGSEARTVQEAISDEAVVKAVQVQFVS